MGEKIKVSIVVPVYNVPEKALRDCIESCIHQTLKNIEIILVDDGSTDNSGVICDEYAVNDNRIKVVHKVNGGLSAARNTGYRMAIGEWILFLDSDDWIEDKTCEDNYAIGMKEDVDIVIFGTIQEFGHCKYPFKYHFENGSIFIGEKCKKLQCEILNFTGNIATAWAKLIRKNILDRYHVEHNEILRQGSEGVEFNIRLFEHIRSAYFTSNIYYHYIYNPNSISAKHNEQNHYFVIKCFEEIQKQISVSDNKDSLEMLFYNRFAYVVVAAAISGYFSPTNKEKYKVQKKKYLLYLNQTLVKNTLLNVKAKDMELQRAVVLFLIKRHCFFPLKLLAKIRYKQKHGG
ncbi:glycosyltransferase family 2 protein [Clostridium sp. OF10-22XD]|nr:glycosyltransferase family 2 protein [Clostridium sp. OF10-22XD]